MPIVLLFAIGFGIAYVRLLNGPMSLKFLAAPVARAISADLAGFGVAIDDVIVALADNGGLEFRLRNVRFSDPDGATVASAPLAGIRLNSNALLQGRIAPARVILIEPQLLLQYTREHGLSLSFARGADADDAGGPSPAVPSPPGGGVEARTAAGAGLRPTTTTPRPIDLARVLALTDTAQSSLGAAAFLKGVGLRNADIVFDDAGVRTRWHVQEAEFGIDGSRQGGMIAGDVALTSDSTPWHLNFVVKRGARPDAVQIQARVRDLVPASIARTLPDLAALAALDFPLDGTADVELTVGGEVTAAAIGLDLKAGRVVPLWAGGAPVPFDRGRIDARLSDDRRRLEIAPSTLAWGGRDRATVTGVLQRAEAAAWSFDLATIDGVLAAEDPGMAPRPIEAFRMRGTFEPTAGTELTEVRLKLKGGEVAINGRLPGSDPAGRLSLQGQLSPMSLATVKSMWPAAIVPPARGWVSHQVVQGRLLSGTFAIQDTTPLAATPSGVARFDTRPAAATWHVSVAMEGADIRLLPKPGFAPVEVPRAQLRLDNTVLEITAADAAIVTSPQRRLPLKAARLYSSDIGSPLASGELTFHALGPLPVAVELVEQQAAQSGRPVKMPGEGIDGRIDAQARIVVPFTAQSADGVRIDMKGRITDGKAKAVFGNYDVNGATIEFEVSEQLLDAKGELLVGGVSTKLAWQRIFAAADEEQPPLRLNASVDAADRVQLGLDVNDLVQGEVPVELTVTPRAQADPLVQLRADLTNAELLLESLAWKKAPGRAAVMQFDIVKSSRQRTDLQNFKVVGDDIAIGGTLVIDGQNRVREFAFPSFTLNVVSRLEVQGTLRDNVWDVKAHGTTFDGRDYFQTLFSVGQLRDKPLPPRKDQTGLDLKADIDTVLGYQDLSLKGLQLEISKRGGQLTKVSAHAVVAGSERGPSRTLEVFLRVRPNEPRWLVARSDDAGQVFRLVNFYSAMRGGRLDLAVNLDGSGPAEKTGQLAVDAFSIMGDPVSYEVGPDNIPGQRPERHVERPELQFDSMRAPFSVGYGQFVLEGADLRGPVLGVVLTGKADFRARTVELGGTYVPLQGLNSIIGYFPILGQLLAGPRGEGVLGMTFAIQGPMDHPQVLVNPLSLGTPGITREMMQMTNQTPRVTPREEVRVPRGPSAAKVGPASAASVSPGGPASAPLVAPKPAPPAATHAPARTATPATGTLPSGGAGTAKRPPPAKAPSANPVPAAKPRVSNDGGWSSQTLPGATPAPSPAKP